jgi:hypothetical protein
MFFAHVVKALHTLDRRRTSASLLRLTDPASVGTLRQAHAYELQCVTYNQWLAPSQMTDTTHEFIRRSIRLVDINIVLEAHRRDRPTSDFAEDAHRAQMQTVSIKCDSFC